MAHWTIPFPSMAWVPGGHPLERKKAREDAPVTLLEFEPGFLDPNWCRRGHVGLVLAGTLGMEYEGSTSILQEGEAFVIDPGTSHRAFNPGTLAVRLVVVARE